MRSWPAAVRTLHAIPIPWSKLASNPGSVRVQFTATLERPYEMERKGDGRGEHGAAPKDGPIGMRTAWPDVDAEAKEEGDRKKEGHGHGRSRRREAGRRPFSQRTGIEHHAAIRERPEAGESGQGQPTGNTPGMQAVGGGAQRPGQKEHRQDDQGNGQE